MKSWIAVASAEHVRTARAGGFMQACHGKITPLRRLKPDDRIIYYSPTATFGGRDKLQSFTAIGRVEPGNPYSVDMGDGFYPFRRAVCWFKSQDAAIKPLLEHLEWTKNNKNWGFQLRFGLFEISEHDMQQIFSAMCVREHLIC
ncbi:EVE domain-containing protein [Legionella geestiana]|uniref:EVE domain-containing protein n=1 Tax=Legionella geestiana TaxID=45065 RepID=UPI001091C887|nr:EVE domain-containing protein [Legionella geestiana]QDQ39458.1 EVE domain-containing protein [Legionella geestiana]